MSSLDNKHPFENNLWYKQLTTVVSSSLEFPLMVLFSLFEVISGWIELIEFEGILWFIHKLLNIFTSLVHLILDACMNSQFQSEKLDEEIRWNKFFNLPAWFILILCNRNEEWIYMGFMVEREQIWGLCLNKNQKGKKITWIKISFTVPHISKSKI